MLKKKGFTLIELLSVIVILAIIALIAVPTIVNIITKVRISSAKANFHGYIDAVENASSLLNINTGKVPTTVDELEVEAKNIDNINLISLTFNEDGDVKKAKAEINGLYCTYKENSDVKCTTEMYAYIKNIYNLTDYDKETIQNVYFVDEPRQVTPIDISVEGNNTVLLYLEENGNIINEKNMYNMYIYSESIISAPKIADNFFKDLIYLDVLDFNDMFDTSNTTSMRNMFRWTAKNSKAFVLDLDNDFDTSKVQDMAGMFYEAGYNSTKFILDLGDKFDTSNVVGMDYMFYAIGNQSTEFTLNLGDKFDTNSVSIMYQMFAYILPKTSDLVLDLGDKFDTSKVKNMNFMFTKLGYFSDRVTLKLGEKFDTSNVTNMNKMFFETGKNSTSFILDLGEKFKFNEGVTLVDFITESGASKLIIPNTVTNIPDGTFKGMNKLKEIVFEHSSTDTILLPTPGETTGAFYNSSNINTTVTTTNDTIKNYDWLSDNRTITFN